MLKRIVENGMILNGYWTSMNDFKDNSTEVDCWFGGLVAAGIAPQINSDSGSALLSLGPRVRHWLDLFRRYGAATESSVLYLHFDDMFLIGLKGGTELGDHRCVVVHCLPLMDSLVIDPQNTHHCVYLVWTAVACTLATQRL